MTPAGSPGGRWDREGALVLFAATLLIHSVAGAWSTARREEGVDFYQFWVVPQVVSHGESADIYDDAERKGLALKYWQRARGPLSFDQTRYQKASDRRTALETAGTPFLYTFFLPWVSGDYERDYWRYQLICSGLGLAAILVLARMFGYSPALACLGAVVFMDGFEPFQSEVRVANVNRLLLFGTTLYVLARARRTRPWASLLGGVILGLLVMFKPIVGLVAGLGPLAKAIRGRYRDLTHEVGGIAIGAVSAFAISSAFFGDGRVWLRWADQLGRLPDAQISVSLGNYAAAMLVHERWGWNPGPYPIALLVSATLLATWLRGRETQASQEGKARGAEFLLEARIVSLGLLAYLLGSKLAWLHYFVLTIPAILLAGRPEAWRGKTSRANVIRGAALTLSVLLVALDPPMELFVIRDPVVWALLVTLGAAMLFVMTLRDLVRDVSDGTGPTP